jgi:hypothetical protein
MPCPAADALRVAPVTIAVAMRAELAMTETDLRMLTDAFLLH